VLLLEKKRFPREKLCGEYITPACIPLMEKLGVLSGALKREANVIRVARFISHRGAQLDVPLSQLPSGGAFGLGLSRSAFDELLLRQAQRSGAEVIEEFQATQPIADGKRITGIEGRLKGSPRKVSFSGSVVIDASGRAAALARSGQLRQPRKQIKEKRIAFKAHFSDADSIDDRVELYFYPSGYGGLSRIENGLANLCFITDQAQLRAAGGDPMKLIETTILRNEIARERLRGAKLEGEWLSAASLHFGRSVPASSSLLAIGDAYLPIDPFTGEGIYVALRSGLIAGRIVERGLAAGAPYDEMAANYMAAHRKEFSERFKACALLRRAAYFPGLANLLIVASEKNSKLAQIIIRATHSEKLFRQATGSFQEK